MNRRERERMKRELREVHELRIRQGMIRFQQGLSASRGERVPMTDICTYYEALFPKLAMHMIGPADDPEIKKLKFEVFYEIMADCKREARKFDS